MTAAAITRAPHRRIYGHSEDVAYAISAENRAIRQNLADLPDPAEFAEALPALIAELLASSTAFSRSQAVTEEIAASLRPLGLVEVRGRQLNNFGAAVRRCLLELDQ